MRAYAGVRIRLATDADVAAIVAVTNDAFAVETFLDGTRTDADDVRQAMAHGAFLVADDASGRLIASVAIEPHEGRGYFGMLAIDPAQQRSGMGGAMVEAAEAYCRERGCTAMDITVLSLRSELLPFYRKRGYVEAGVEDFHPRIPLRPGLECHCIRMSKPLTSPAPTTP